MTATIPSPTTSVGRALALALALLALFALALPQPALAQRGGSDDAEASENGEDTKDVLNPGTFAGLSLRGIGPAMTSGRISDLAVVPGTSTYYVAVASGGVWKTTDWGTTFEPIFDGQSSYSIGTVTVDPNNPNVVWVGTGENNSQRSVSWGDGVYKSTDGGKSWKNMGLEGSRHIGDIVVDPRDSDVVYVAAMGLLWGPNDERGLYKTTDGGETWEQVLEISENTGVVDIEMDPRDPDVLYAAAYQRRRRVWTLLNGGPESGIHKSTDGGATWQQLSSGLPRGDVGRIGLAISPVDPDVVYAIIEAAGDAGGFFRSTDRGASWSKRGDYVSGSPQYYQEIIASPHDVDTIYSNDTFFQVSRDGGASFSWVGQRFMHVDHHALWIDPDDPLHLLTGNDGGIYETWDGGEHWQFKPNLPVTQFYKITVSQHGPFYHVYGGTQDNFTLGGPARTRTIHGIQNSDWYVVQGGDGFQPRVDPTDPNIVYGQAQYGVLVRYDRASGETVSIQPQGAPGEEPLKWNWDSPLIISPHSPTRLYFAANKLYRSDNRGDSWTLVSPDLTRGIDRNELEVMGQVWSIDAVAKNASTSFYGNSTALSESPLVEGLLYVGTDDGLIQVTEDGGETWRAVDNVPGVERLAYVSRVEASLHDPDTVYAAFNNHKNGGDFAPYVFKSTDRGRTWTSIASNLPETGPVHAIAQDHERPELLFVGTEYGVFFSVDEGGTWVQLSSGIPTIAVRDLAIQRGENDLVAGTFGRGFFVLDDYSPLREVNREALEAGDHLFPVRDPLMYIPQSPLGVPGKGFQGETHFTADNPPFGAVFTYYLQEGPKTLEAQRKEREKELGEEGEPIPYPSWDELRAEEREERPMVLLTVRDSEGEVVYRLTGPAAPGFHRVAWGLRYPSSAPTSLRSGPSNNPFFSPMEGPLVAPGTYTVEAAKVVRGETTPIGEPVAFEAQPLGLATLDAEDKEAVLAFQQKAARLQRAAMGISNAMDEAEERLRYIRQAILDTPAAGPEFTERARGLQEELADLRIELEGDRTVASRNEPTVPSIGDRIFSVVYGTWNVTSAPTGTQRDDYRWAAEAFAEFLPRAQSLIEEDLVSLEADLEAAGAPWTPGRVPDWQPE